MRCHVVVGFVNRGTSPYTPDMRVTQMVDAAGSSYNMSPEAYSATALAAVNVNPGIQSGIEWVVSLPPSAKPAKVRWQDASGAIAQATLGTAGGW